MMRTSQQHGSPRISHRNVPSRSRLAAFPEYPWVSAHGSSVCGTCRFPWKEIARHNRRSRLRDDMMCDETWQEKQENRCKKKQKLIVGSISANFLGKPTSGSDPTFHSQQSDCSSSSLWPTPLQISRQSRGAGIRWSAPVAEVCQRSHHQLVKRWQHLSTATHFLQKANLSYRYRFTICCRC